MLAAGASRRMGSPKALLDLGGQTLLELWLARLRPFCARRLVVVGAVVQPIAERLGADEQLVVNERWAETGPYESLRLGLGALRGVDRVLVSPVDVPPPRAEELERLLAADAPAALSWEGRPGHPVLIGACEIARILTEPTPSGGLSSLLTRATQVPADSASTLMNLNTPEDLARWRDYCSRR